MSKIKVSYGKIYTDDSGKHTQNIFGTQNPLSISYKLLWNGVVDGFFICENSDILITATEGNMRVVIVAEEYENTHKFEQYFISGLDGKILTIPSGIKYAFQNMDEKKTSFLIGAYQLDLEFKYSSKRIFNWRKKNP